LECTNKTLLAKRAIEFYFRLKTFCNIYCS